MLAFDSDALHGLIAQYNEAIWPLQIIAYGIGAVLLAAMLRPMRHGARVVWTVLAAAWVWTGVAYHLIHFATINFVAPVFGAAFILQSGLFALAAGRNAPQTRFANDAAGWGGAALLVAAMTISPLGAAFGVHGWAEIAVVGVAPGPTALATLGAVILARPRPPLHLLIIPLAWCAVAVVTGWLLDLWPDLVFGAAGLAALPLAVWVRLRAH